MMNQNRLKHVLIFLTTLTSASASSGPDWLGISGNFEYALRNTNYYDSGFNTGLFQGDARLEIWPLNSQRFFGPYIRGAYISSNKDVAWENAWLSSPGFGIQSYPFSLLEDSDQLKRLFGPLRIFGEFNKMDYMGGINAWRPDEQIRAGAEIWYPINTREEDLLDKEWWSEIWTGLWWQSANEFDKDYDTLIFGHSVRFGIRDPEAGMWSRLSPYIVCEGSVTENKDYYWENRIILGGGIRYQLPLFSQKDNPLSIINRLIIFGEYDRIVGFWDADSPSNIPDYDIRAGIGLSIGEWWFQPK
jgi:hypothetical protein